MKDYTDITVVLDRSGSMETVKEATINGFDEFVQMQRKQGDNAGLTLVQFDNEYENVWNGMHIATVPSIKNLYQPRGMTALLDAIGRTINETGARLARLPESQRPNKVIMVIMTDGFENASREFTREKIFEMIRHQESKYNWSFIFLGANQDAIATATNLGMKGGWAATYNNNACSIDKTFRKMSEKVSAYRCCTSDFEACCFVGNDKLFTEEDRKEIDAQ